MLAADIYTRLAAQTFTCTGNIKIITVYLCLISAALRSVWQVFTSLSILDMFLQ